MDDYAKGRNYSKYEPMTWDPKKDGIGEDRGGGKDK